LTGRSLKGVNLPEKGHRNKQLPQGSDGEKVV